MCLRIRWVAPGRVREVTHLLRTTALEDDVPIPASPRPGGPIRIPLPSLLCVLYVAAVVLALAGCMTDSSLSSSTSGARSSTKPSPASGTMGTAGSLPGAAAPEVFRGEFEEEILLTGELKAVRARTVVA